MSSNIRGLSFTAPNTFTVDIRRRINREISEHNLLNNAYYELWIKGFFMVVWLLVSVRGLILGPHVWWAIIPYMLSTALSTVGVAFNIGHDFIHRAGMSKKMLERSRALRVLNVLGKMSFDAIGASSYVWYVKHVLAHHSLTNVTAHDTDIEQAPGMRLDPAQRHHFWYRGQHYYAWVVYGLLVPKWHFAGDFLNLRKGVIGQTKIPKMRLADLLTFWGGKLFFFSWAFGLPLYLYHDSWKQVFAIIGIYLGTGMMAGIVLALVFQLAHAIDGAKFVVPSDQNKIEGAWGVHQLETTRDFYYNGWFLNRTLNGLMSFYLGGLNFQAIHHILPTLPHTLYPRIWPTFAAFCAENNVEYVRLPVSRAIFLHGRWLRKMGRRPATSKA